MVCKNSGETIFIEICGIMPLMRGLGSWNRNFGDFLRAKRSEKPFLAVVAKVAA